MREYTPIVDGFQIRDIIYIGLESDSQNKNNPTSFDIVKWEECEPHEVIDEITNKKKVITKFCYSVGYLEWDEKESCFEFKSVGLRWLEANPTERVIKMTLMFCKMMEVILNLENNN